MWELTHALGLAGTIVLALGLLASFYEWRMSLYIWFRPVVIVTGAASGWVLYWFARHEFNVLAWVYLVLIGALILVHSITAAIALARADWRINITAHKGGEKLHPLLKKAIGYDKLLSFPAAVVAYDDYLAECPSDVRAKGQLAEALIKAGNAKRAISVLTIAFTEAEDPKLKIAFGIRLAEVILVAERDPLNARAQLEQVKKLFAGTEHEKYVERLSLKMMKRVAEGKYLKSGRPRR